MYNNNSMRPAAVAVVTVVCFVLFAAACVGWPVPQGNLNTTAVHFYQLDKQRYCPAVEIYVRAVVQKWYFRDPSYTAAFLRLFYSDCFVNGCDASILLDGKKSEKTAKQNIGLRGFEVIDDIKKMLEAKCPGKVSCADILALATRDFVALAGGPAYPTPTGRKDGLSSSAEDVKLPSPDISFKDALALFQSKGLDVSDLVTLLGGHTIGKARCSYPRNRIYNYQGTGKADPTMNETLVASLKKSCPKTTEGNYVKNESAVFITNGADPESYVLDNTFYQKILTHEALFALDQSLAYDNTTLQLVQANAQDFDSYKFAIADSMARMSNIGVLTGNQGQIRRSCRLINK